MLVIGGILAGIFTATEAGAIAVLYALLLSAVVYREIGEVVSSRYLRASTANVDIATPETMLPDKDR